MGLDVWSDALSLSVFACILAGSFSFAIHCGGFKTLHKVTSCLLHHSACSVAASFKPPMLVTRVRLPACAFYVALLIDGAQHKGRNRTKACRNATKPPKNWWVTRGIVSPTIVLAPIYKTFCTRRVAHSPTHSLCDVTTTTPNLESCGRDSNPRNVCFDGAIMLVCLCRPVD